MIPTYKIWNIRQNDCSLEHLKELNLPKPIISILNNRGINNIEIVNRFLNPRKEDFYDPFLLRDMGKAVKRIEEAMVKKQKVTIYGDYDVDGITSTSCLYLFLKELGIQVDYYIPDRLKEGYGINIEALKYIKDNGTQLVITVDTGITAVEESKYAKDIELDMIITDHHECQEELPQAIAIIDPKQKNCSYPFDKLAGVGVAFKLIQALARSIESINEDIIWKYLDIVAIGTVADIVPLIDENRIITKLGFSTIPNTWNVGLQALLQVSQYKDNQKITAGFIGYRLAPRLNAGGRMGDAKRGIELFTTNDIKKANNLAKELDNENINRQELEEKIFNEVVQIIESTIDVKNEKVLVVASKNWHHGVIGIVASKITERYYRPSVLLCIEEDVATGSARSIEGFNIFEALSNSKKLFNKFGGHEMAAGMSINEENIQVLREQLNTFAQKVMKKETLIPKLKADMQISIDLINLNLLEIIGKLEPYGVGNPEPQFIIKGTLSDLRLIGQNQKHVKMLLKKNKKRLDGVGFNMCEYYPYFKKDDNIEVLCSLNINEWNGKKQPQMMLKDLKFDSKSQNLILQYYDLYSNLKKQDQSIKKYIQTNKILINIKKDWETFYRLLNKFEKDDKSSLFIHNIFLFEKSNEHNYIKLFIMLDVFAELNLLTYNIDIPFFTFQLIKGKKVKLEDSKLYCMIC